MGRDPPCEWGLLRPTGCKALWCWPALRLPALLPPRLCGAARWADGPSSSSLATPASQARRGLRWAGRNAAQAPEVDAASERMIASCSRSRLAKNTWMMSLWSERSGYLLGSTNWSGAEGCDDEHLAVTRNAGAQLQLRDHALQCPSSWRAVAPHGPALGGPERVPEPCSTRWWRSTRRMDRPKNTSSRSWLGSSGGSAGCGWQRRPCIGRSSVTTRPAIRPRAPGRRSPAAAHR